MIILTKIKEFVKTHSDDIILLIGVVLISLLSFTMGYIMAKQQEKKPIKIEYRDTNILIHTNNVTQPCCVTFDTNNLLV